MASPISPSGSAKAKPLAAVERLAERFRKAWASSLSTRFFRVLSIARKEIRQLKRDHLTLGFIVGVPAVQLLLFGYAINQDVRHIRTALVDFDNTAVSRHLVGQLEATQTFRIVHRSTSETEARELMQRGDVKVVVMVPADYTRAYYRGRGAEISILVDATDPIIARAVQASANGLMERHNKRLQSFYVGPKGEARRMPRQRSSFATEPDLIRTQFLRFAVLNLYNPELRTPVFVVPALLGVILTTTMILMTALSIVRERERGSFEFLIATPVQRIELMAGKIIPYIMIGFIQILIVVITGLLLFRVPVAGSLFDLGVISIIFIAANLTLGLVISSVCSTQFQATELSFFFFLPSVILSGFMFPFDSMPKPAQWIGETLPLTHFIRATRGILLRGASPLDQLREMSAMLLFCAVGFITATLLFKKKLG
jgi:ABC-2 type transport system permease protein